VEDGADDKKVGNHAKFFIVDDKSYYIGSQNLYTADLSEWGIIVDDEEQTKKVLAEYWDLLWRASYNKDSPSYSVEDIMSRVGVKVDKAKLKSELTDAELEEYNKTMSAAGYGSSYSLAVNVKRAKNLRNADSRYLGQGVSDPYVVAHIEDRHGEWVVPREQTRVIDDNLDPEWHEILMFEGIPTPAECCLVLEVFDQDKVLFCARLAKHDPLGSAKVQLSELAKSSKFQDFELVLEPGDPEPKIFFGVNTLGDWGIPPPEA
jgi:hypothetical protein